MKIRLEVPGLALEFDAEIVDRSGKDYTLQLAAD